MPTTTTTFKASELRKMLVACGVDTAGEWPMKKLKAKVDGGVAKYKEDTHEIKDAKLAELYDDIVALQEANEEFEIEDDVTEAKPAKQPKPEPAAKEKPAAKPKPKQERQEGESRVGPSWTELKETWKTKPQQLTGRGEGKIKFIVDTLIDAGKKKDPKGVTKEEMLELMKEQFPESDANKMKTTINNQIPSRLKLVRHINVWKNSDTKGYYISGDGSKVQPKAEKTAKPKAAAKPSANGDGAEETPAAKKPAAKAAAKPAAKQPSKPAAKAAIADRRKQNRPAAKGSKK